jgi:hypothetical protein
MCPCRVLKTDPLLRTGALISSYKYSVRDVAGIHS